jgi:phage-related protein
LGRQNERDMRSNLKNWKKQQARCQNQMKQVRKAIERLTRSNRVKFGKQLKEGQEATEEMQEKNKICVKIR